MWLEVGHDRQGSDFISLHYGGVQFVIVLLLIYLSGVLWWRHGLIDEALHVLSQTANPGMK